MKKGASNKIDYIRRKRMIRILKKKGFRKAERPLKDYGDILRIEDSEVKMEK